MRRACILAVAGVTAWTIADGSARADPAADTEARHESSSSPPSGGSHPRPEPARGHLGPGPEAATPAVSACRLDPAGTGRVAAVVDGRSFRLDDGREIRLAGIEVPLLPRAGESDSGAGPAQASRAALEALIGGQVVELRQSEAAIDRYGRHVAHAYVLGSEGARSAAHEMLARGFAQVGTRVGERACAEELWARERLARAGRLGLWRGPFYAVLTAQSLAELKVDAGQFAIAEGRVWSVRESGATIYMNFGRRWSEALTVTISKRNERTFVAAGLDPKGLKSRRVRVRGFVEERSGPRIEATRPEQIEIVEPN